MEEDLRALLLADASVAALVDARVTWGARPQGSLLPAVLLHLTGGARGYTLTAAAGPLSTRVQVNCLADSYLAALTVFRAVSAALSGFSGIAGGTYFQGVLQDGEATDLSNADGATEQRTFGITADFIVHHTLEE
jgi:hypothetical protein